jgi:prenyltransferase beta subunit
MHRFAMPLLLTFCFILPLRAEQPTAEQKQATVKYLYSLQKDSGAFVADTKPDSKPALGATSSALRAIKYFGGEIKNKEGAAKFVASCFNKEDGGFAPTPGGKADVRSTAVGLMAAISCEKSLEPYISPCTTFLCSHSESFEEMRIAAAAYEAIKSKCTLTDTWVAKIEKMRNADGTFGSGDGQARDTGSAAAALLRLGVELDNREKVIQAMKAGQRPDGAWGKAGEKSDLETTYRVMRCLMMLKAKPDIAAAEAFIAKCRNADGSYGVQPGQPGNVSGTYYAGICLHWLEEMKK